MSLATANIQQTAQSIESTGLHITIYNSRPAMRDLVEWLHDLIKWEEFGDFLPGIRSTHIEMIKANLRNAEVNEKKRALYDQWLRIDSNATWSNVIEALEKINENTLAAKIKSKLIDSTSTGVSVSSSATSGLHYGGKLLIILINE